MPSQSVGCCQETGSESPRSMSGSRYITRRSPGTASRARCSAASLAAAIWRPCSWRPTASLAPTSSSSGPRCSVRRWMTRSTADSSSPSSAALMAMTCSTVAASPRSRDFISMERTIATVTSSVPISAVPTASQIPLPVASVMLTPNSAKTRPNRAARSSSRMTGSSGALAVRTNSAQDRLPRTWLLSVMAVRKENPRARSRSAGPRSAPTTHTVHGRSRTGEAAWPRACSSCHRSARDPGCRSRRDRLLRGRQPGPGQELLRVEVEAEQGVLDDFAERRVNPVLPPRHLGHGLPKGHPLDQRLDQVRRLRTHEVRAEQFARGWVRDHFADTCGVLQRPAVCRVAVRLRLRDVLAALGLELLLGQSDAGDLRRGEDRLGDEAVVEACLLYTSPSPRDGLLSRMPSSA